MKLYVERIDPAIEDGELRGIFSRFGTVYHCGIRRKMPSRISLGDAIIDVCEDYDVDAATKELNDMVIKKENGLIKVHLPSHATPDSERAIVRRVGPSTLPEVDKPSSKSLRDFGARPTDAEIDSAVIG